MKLTKEDLIKKVSEAGIDDEFKITLLEDITDSFEVLDKSKFVEVEKYDELKDKYIKRFTEGAVSEEKPAEKGEPEDEEDKETTYEDIFIKEE